MFTSVSVNSVGIIHGFSTYICKIISNEWTMPEYCFIRIGRQESTSYRSFVKPCVVRFTFTCFTSPAWIAKDKKNQELHPIFEKRKRVIHQKGKPEKVCRNHFKMPTPKQILFTERAPSGNKMTTSIYFTSKVPSFSSLDPVTFLKKFGALTFFSYFALFAFKDLLWA